MTIPEHPDVMANLLKLCEATATLKRGGVIAYPTEAVWGLGCDPMNQAAVLRLLEIKQRPVDKGVILVAAHFDQLKPLLDVSALSTDRLAEVLATWPGPYTWIMPSYASTPGWLTGTHDGIAVRISDHPVVTALCDAFGSALVSTSANFSGASPPKSRSEFDPALLRKIDGFVEGAVGGLDRPTQIRDARSGSVLRD